MSLRFYPPYTRLPSYVAAEIQSTLRTFTTPITMANAQNAGVVTLRAMLEQRFVVQVDGSGRLVSLNGATPHGGFVYFVQGIRHPASSDIGTIYVAPGNIVEVIGAK